MLKARDSLHCPSMLPGLSQANIADIDPSPICPSAKRANAMKRPSRDIYEPHL
jgi:hypothetical protein